MSTWNEKKNFGSCTKFWFRFCSTPRSMCLRDTNNACLLGWVWCAEMLLRLTTLQFCSREWPCMCSTAACTMKLEPATLTWTGWYQWYWTKWSDKEGIPYLHRLVPVILAGSQTFRAKVGDTVDQVVKTSQIGCNLRNNLETVGSHRDVQFVKPWMKKWRSIGWARSYLARSASPACLSSSIFFAPLWEGCYKRSQECEGCSGHFLTVFVWSLSLMRITSGSRSTIATLAPSLRNLVGMYKENEKLQKAS